MSMQHLNLFLVTTLTIGCQSHSASLKDSGIVTTTVESQGGSAFCWSYALVAHLEQRYFQRTRGEQRGGFRLNLSEEYLGLMHLLSQLLETEAPSKFNGDGLRLGLGLDLYDRFGIVPERVAGKILFRAKFKELLGAKLLDKAMIKSGQLGGRWPLGLSDAIQVLAEVAGLTAEQSRFLQASYEGDAAASSFMFANRRYTPQSFSKLILKFKREEYFVLQMPKSGKNDDGSGQFSEEYLRAQKIIQKSILYGYSVPISFNFVSNSIQQDGELKCTEQDCPFSELTESGNPHSNHAVLALDYRQPNGEFGVLKPDQLSKSIQHSPDAWLIKNSWGFNHNVNNDPKLLKRFPVPIYTEMNNDFFATSHRLNPGRYDAIVPKRLCVREKMGDRGLICEDLVSSAKLAGLPPKDEVNLTINTDLLTGSLAQLAQDRAPLSLSDRVDGSDGANFAIRFSDASQASVSELLPRINFQPDITTGRLIEDRVHLCVAASVAKDIKMIPVYVIRNDSSEEKLPHFILDSESGWRHCTVIPNERAEYRVIMQGIDKRWKTRSQVSANLSLSGE
jgi:hypothetical protein